MVKIEYKNKVFEAYCPGCEEDKPHQYISPMVDLTRALSKPDEKEFKDYHFINCNDCKHTRTIRTGRLEELINE